MSEPVEPIPIEEVQLVQGELAQGESWCSGGLTGTQSLPPWEKSWCTNIPPSCAAMQEACKPPPEAEGCDRQTSAPAPMPEFSPSTTNEDAFQGVIIAVIVVALISAVVSYLRLKPLDPPPPPDPNPDWNTPKGTFAPVINLNDYPNPLQAARDALAQGKIGLAMMLLRALALDALEKRGRLVLHPSRTDREYVRALSEFPGERALLAELVREIERQRYAAQPLEGESIERAFEATRKLVEQP